VVELAVPHSGDEHSDFIAAHTHGLGDPLRGPVDRRQDTTAVGFSRPTDRSGWADLTSILGGAFPPTPQEPTVDDEIQLISDGDGLAVIGNPQAVERFLTSERLPSKDLGLQRLKPALGTGAAVVQAGSEIAANSGRWVKLTKESAKLISKHGLMKNSKTGLHMGVAQAKGGQIEGIVQFAKGPGVLLTNPAVLAGAAGIMAQLAMQQAGLCTHNGG
jgi:hypothetical protein